MRRNPRIDHLARLVENLLDGLAAHGRPAPTVPRIRAALREPQHGRRPPAAQLPPVAHRGRRSSIAP